MRSFVVFALVGLVCAVPSPSPATHVVHERRSFTPLHWNKARRLDSGSLLPMRFGLKQNNVDKLAEFLNEVAHPESPMYGQHWSLEKIADTFAPKPDTINAVKNWLIDSGFEVSRLRMSPSKGWIQVDATAAEAESLLKTEYHVYEHKDGAKHVACDSYSVPDHISDHIELITPTIHFGPRKPSPIEKRKTIQKRQKASNPAILKAVGTANSGNGPKTNGKKVSNAKALDLSTCDQVITPDCLRALYQIDYTPKATAKNSYGIVEFTPQAFLQDDLQTFYDNFAPEVTGPNGAPVLVSIDGGIDQTTNQGFDFNGESDLDLEYAIALTNPQNITLLQTGDVVEGASFNNWLDAIDGSFCTFEGGDDPNFDGIYPDPIRGGFKGPASCGIIPPPAVVSVSYGADEVDVTAAYAERQCTEYGKLGLAGSTILYSSGDNGVAGFNDVCLDKTGAPATRGNVFNPGFPVGCPFVTAVGATQVDPGAAVTDPEGACEQVIFSGGGFSNIFKMPDYQADAVNKFLKAHKPPFNAGQFNTSGSRAFPDVSANGANYAVAVAGELALVFGTSASSPVFGSIITLINDARLAAGKKTVGFINPTIYSSGFKAAFNDITHGTNQGCGTSGFESVKGWDPVTGLGTPIFPKLLKKFLALP